MDGSNRLKDFLQLQLASDSYAVLHLPFVLETLSKEDFLPSSHTLKWIARVNSLIHSKDPAARWSGLCLAFQTATFSRDIMLECAQSWVGAAMPLLVNQPLPTTKAAIRLLRLVFSSAMDVTEYQRQLCIPNVPKYASALIALLEKDSSTETAVLAIDTLEHIVSLYPSLCRPLHNQLSNVALRSLNGSAPTPMSDKLVEACSRLYAVLPLTGGKVNAPSLWRKSLDDTMTFAWGAFLQVRTTYPDRGYGVPHLAPPSDDPIVDVPLALDRLRAATRVIGDLLRTSTSRPISLPVGPLVRLCLALLQSTLEDKGIAHANHVVHALEASVIPTLWGFACEILISVAKAGRHHLTPHLPPLLTSLAYHLEQPQNLIASRLVRATLPKLAILLSKRSQAGTENEQASGQGRSKKGRRHARGYEGDEVFKVGRRIVCVTAEEGDVLLVSVDLLEILLSRTQVNAPVHSIASRLLLAIYASLPQLPPSILSSDLSLKQRLCAKLKRLCMGLAIGTTSTMSKCVGLVLSISDGTVDEDDDLTVHTTVDLLLHPRAPPLVRSLPHVELLSLFRAEEGEEEADTRRRVGLHVLDERSDRLPDATGSQTPHEAEWTRLQPSVPQAARSPGAPSAQEPYGTVAMQVDVSPLAPTAGQASRDPPSSAGLERSQPPTSFAHKQSATHRTAQSPLPPPDPLPSNSTALSLESKPASDLPVTQATAPLMEDDDDDEPMPTIDLASDSESE
ncbi:hypothetical protein DICSQDRAFT_71225 [Dichomitus squalens LYAD-421 SS1]|uniref:Pre-rRNA-processing protein RIX1 n=1 Tax=Dichomitus squalens (strain LYAD-421) TaxID=732165 RepID=R7SKD3_DICSQ|nr:uncharacterized protein DICSQDRAFT_71225 [Dichomitus squalens LYAD-421 SS1]EJF56606.1 hypothetical protein DICSQDRAFT_71225 [Dichomitus squalens LYAD-421 SS1]